MDDRRCLFQCPVDNCDWMHLQREVKATHDTLAGVFGPGIMLAVNRSQILADTEREIENHLKSHTIVEWVNTVMRLKRAAGEVLSTAGSP